MLELLAQQMIQVDWMRHPELEQAAALTFKRSARGAEKSGMGECAVGARSVGPRPSLPVLLLSFPSCGDAASTFLSILRGVCSCALLWSLNVLQFGSWQGRPQQC